MAANSNSMLYQIGASVKTHVNTEITSAINALLAGDNSWTGSNTFKDAADDFFRFTQHQDNAFLFTATNGDVVSDSTITITQTTANSDTQLNVHDIAIGGNATIGEDVTITGNLTVNGTTTSLSTTNTTIEDSIINLADGAGGADGTATYSNDIGFIFNRGGNGTATRNPAFMAWDNSASEFALGITANDATSATLSEQSRTTLKVGSVKIWEKYNEGGSGYKSSAHYTELGDLEDFDGGLA